MCAKTWLPLLGGLEEIPAAVSDRGYIVSVFAPVSFGRCLVRSQGGGGNVLSYGPADVLKYSWGDPEISQLMRVAFR